MGLVLLLTYVAMMHDADHVRGVVTPAVGRVHQLREVSPSCRRHLDEMLTGSAIGTRSRPPQVMYMRPRPCLLAFWLAQSWRHRSSALFQPICIGMSRTPTP
jgi:hypothetical protein